MIRTSEARARAPSFGVAAVALAVSALMVACGGGGDGDGGGADGSFPAPTTSSPNTTTNTPQPTQPTAPIVRTLAPGAELAPTLGAPQPGSTALTGDDKQGIYLGDTGLAFITPAGRLMYKDASRWIFGWLDVSGASWSFRAPTIGLSVVPNSNLEFVTGSGIFAPRKLMEGTYSIDGGRQRTWGQLRYSASNALAVQQKDMSGTWSATGSAGYDMSIEVDADGKLTGTASGVLSGECSLSGTLVQTEPSTSRNMFNLKLTATNAGTRPGDRACGLQQDEYDGLAVVFMNAVSDYPEEGAYRTLVFHAGSITGGFLTNNLRKQ